MDGIVSETTDKIFEWTKKAMHYASKSEWKSETMVVDAAALIDYLDHLKRGNG